MSDEIIIPEKTATKKPQLVKRVLPPVLSILGVERRPIFPGLVVPLTFDDEQDLKAIKAAIDNDSGYIGLSLVKDLPVEEGAPDDLEDIGTVFQIMRIVPAAPGVFQVLGQGISRFKKRKTILIEPSQRWEVEHISDSKEKPSAELKAYMLAISDQLKEILQLNPVFKEQVNQVVSQLNYDNPGLTMDLISNMLSADAESLQSLLESFPLLQRAEQLLELIKKEVEIVKIQSQISEQVNEKINKQQREFFLKEQLNAIKKELGIEKEDKETDVEKIEKKLNEKALSEEAQKVVEQELNKLKLLNAQSPEYNVTRNYLEAIADLPWGIHSEDNTDIIKARKILDKEHYGLQDVKTMILEFLSTIIRKGKVGGSIICLVGPPGVGKTSIGKSVAEALGRKFFRFSVGGMRDEAEIKGHRRTYIGAMPGKLIQSLQRVGTANPVVMLDEIDKIGKSFQGDPASALLEVLDPEQNPTFLDHYLDVPFDLSKVLFITTANQLDTIPGPLLDRMEIIRVSGYILEDKLQIAKKYLVPKQLEAHGFGKKEIKFTDKALKFIIDKYAREAGVRNLEKLIRRVIRKINLQIAEKKEADAKVDVSDVEKYLGKPIFNTEELYKKLIPGVVLGLAYTSYGGATLYIEANAIKTKGAGLKQTGQLGSVMKESSEIAYSYIRSLLSHKKDESLAAYFDNHLVHLHVPAGATPKDGPSAGITMALALYSLATGKPIKKGIAMTGELTLTGKVLPIGGVKEKTIGAKRVGIKELIFPIANKKDFEELPDHIKKGLKVHFADYFEDVLKVAYPKGY